MAIVLGAGYLLWAPNRREAATPATRSAPAAVSTQGGAVVALPVGAAVIEGEVRFTGDAPAPGKLHREADPYCARKEMTDPTVLVANRVPDQSRGNAPAIQKLTARSVARGVRPKWMPERTSMGPSFTMMPGPATT